MQTTTAFPHRGRPTQKGVYRLCSQTGSFPSCRSVHGMHRADLGIHRSQTVSLPREECLCHSLHTSSTSLLSHRLKSGTVRLRRLSFLPLPERGGFPERFFDEACQSEDDEAYLSKAMKPEIGDPHHERV